MCVCVCIGISTNFSLILGLATTFTQKHKTQTDTHFLINMGNKKGGIIEDIEKQEEEDDEVLPLSEFPLNSDNPDSDTDGHGPSSNPSPPQLFQFFRDDYTPQHMSSAEDIIFHGRLVPFKQAPPPHPPPRPPNYRRLLGRQFGSLSDSKTSRPEIQVRYERNCRSLDSQKTGRSEIDRNSSGKSVGSVSGGRSTRFTKFRWLMFGMVKLPPPEMELRDIKNRQTRRSPTTMFSPDSRRSGSGKGSSAVLRALSCRDDASVAVAMPFGCVPST